MSRVSVLLLVLVLVVVALAAGASGRAVTADANERLLAPAGETRPTDQIIIGFDSPAAAQGWIGTEAGELLPALSQAAGVPVRYLRPMYDAVHVLKLEANYPAKEVAEMGRQLAALDGVAYADPDLWMAHFGDPVGQEAPQAPDANPNDPLFANQWHYKYTANTAEGLHLPPAWDITTGSTGMVVAVIDTGYRPHADLSGKFVQGYDFIGDLFVANDGNGRDSDASDPGDWVTANQCGYPHPAQPSSWHGTHVAGTIGAVTNNNNGVAGVNWLTKILPVRVLGKCGGYSSDIIDGLRWAAGLSVTGVPANANPAKVLNLSLGGLGSCDSAWQNAVNAAVSAGSTVVVAAGNENANAANYTPGNCNNVITVAANDKSGDRAYYSNYGAVVEITAPGGAQSFANDPNGVLSTLNSGTTTPAADNYIYYQGTSMAAPHVAGLASLILTLQPGYTPAQVQARIQSTARAFPAGSTCNTSICGSGIADAYYALNGLSGPPMVGDFYLPMAFYELPPPPPPPANPFVNPTFELGPVGWTQYSTHGWQLITTSFPSGLVPHSGVWAVWLGGDYNETSYIQQTVTIPAAAPYLAYWHWIASQDVCGYDFGGVLVNGAVVHVYNLCTSTNTNGWVKKVVNLGAYAGQTVAVQIRAETDGSLNSNLFVDDVSVQATPAAPEVPAGGAADPLFAQERAAQ
jgi:serine protease